MEITADDIAALLHEIVGLIEVFEYLECVHAVLRTIDAALLEQGQLLFRSIASNPTAWVDLAVRVQSTSIFQEAVVHCKFSLLSRTRVVICRDHT
jgi:hypothetical protein